MGGFSRFFKGIGKFIKKIGRGIKKVVKKVGRALKNNIGIVGTIGLMFLMPYAMQGLGSLFQGLNAAQVGTWAHTLAQGGQFAQTVSSVMNGIHTAGTWAFGSGAGTLRGAISEGVGKLLGTGGTDLASAAKALSKQGTVALKSGVNVINYGTGAADPSASWMKAMSKKASGALTSGARVQAGYARATGSKMADKAWSLRGPSMASTADPRAMADTNLLDQTIQSTTIPLIQAEPLPILGAGTQAPFTIKAPLSGVTSPANIAAFKYSGSPWYSRLGTTARNQWDSITTSISEITAGEIAKDALVSGLTTRGAHYVAGDPPVQKTEVIQRPDLTSDLITSNTSNIYANADLMFQKIGNSYQGPNLMNFDAIKAIGNDGTADYHANMRGLEFMVSQPSYAF